MSGRLNLQQLITRHKDGFRIAAYQRHYVWGQYRQGDKDAVAFLTECLLMAFAKGEPYYLQGITVRGSHLIDGQQRITYLLLLLRTLGYCGDFCINYDNRPEAQAWLRLCSFDDIAEDPHEPSQDIYFFKRTLRVIRGMLDESQVDKAALLDYLLQHVEFLYISIPEGSNQSAIYKMMNGTKTRMADADIIKADVMRLASDPDQPASCAWELSSLRVRYAAEWDAWVRWWLRDSVRWYFSKLGEMGIDLLIKLCLRQADSDYSQPLTYEEFRLSVISAHEPAYKTAKNFFARLRNAQRRFTEALDDNAVYNKLQAIMLLQQRSEMYRFLHLYFIDKSIDDAELDRYYRLSFLGMSIDEIYRHEPVNERFYNLLASLSVADVYHSDTKRDVFYLLLRLNIDEDIKLKRRFDFSVWDNRSLEHIYSKSKVWHSDASGKIYDGNDNELSISRRRIEADPSFMHRDKIVNRDGTQLSEHCIGNLVLLYGQNNATFGNATFDQKKQMFLSPGDSTVFMSRNLLHTVCVFSGNAWDHRSIVENYNLTLKNLKSYYGFK